MVKTKKSKGCGCIMFASFRERHTGRVIFAKDYGHKAFVVRRCRKHQR